MNVKQVCRVVLMGTLSVSLSIISFAHASAQSRSAKPRPESDRLPSEGQVDGAVAGIVVGLVAGTAVVLYLILRKPTITGCVSSGGNGMTLTADDSKRSYKLVGNTEGVTAGDRVKLQGKKEKSTVSSSPLVWETEKLSKDYGACRL